MLNMKRLAALAAVVILAMPAVLVAQGAAAQTPPPAPATAPAATPPAAPTDASAPPAMTAPAVAPAPAAKAAAATEIVDNPYGLDALWKGGDFVARSR